MRILFSPLLHCFIKYAVTPEDTVPLLILFCFVLFCVCLIVFTSFELGNVDNIPIK